MCRDFPFGSLQGSFGFAPHLGQGMLFSCFVVSVVFRGAEVLLEFRLER